MVKVLADSLLEVVGNVLSLEGSQVTFINVKYIVAGVDFKNDYYHLRLMRNSD